MIKTLSELVAQVESGNQPFACRYEPGFAKYVTRESMVKIRSAYKPAWMSEATARALLMFSWGRYQIMGENLYALGLDINLVHFQNDLSLQDHFFWSYCRSRKIVYSLEEVLNDEKKRLDFALKYNGGTNYAKKLVATAQYMGVV